MSTQRIGLAASRLAIAIACVTTLLAPMKASNGDLVSVDGGKTPSRMVDKEGSVYWFGCGRAIARRVGASRPAERHQPPE
jgi:hypothetical protein